MMVPGKTGQGHQAPLIKGVITPGSGKIDIPGKACCQNLQTIGGTKGQRHGWYNGHDQAIAMGQQIIQRKVAFSLWRPALADGQQFTQTAIGIPVLRPYKNVRCAIGKDQAASPVQRQARPPLQPYGP